MATKEMYDLLKIGLTKGEAKVYLALSGLGSSTVGPIVKDSGVAYSNIYEILNRLIEKGIVSFVIKNKIKHFQAAPPSNLLKYLDEKEKSILEQKEALKGILPDLEKIQEGKESQEAEVFLGIKGLKTAYEKLFVNASKKDEELFFYIHEPEYAEESDLFYNSMAHLLKKARNRGIVNRKYKGSWYAKKTKELNMKFVDFPIPGNIDILDDKILIVDWKASLTAILIHSKTIADNFRNYFEQVWKIAKK